VIVKRDNRQTHLLGCCKPNSCIFCRDDVGTETLKPDIAAGVVAVHVRIDHIADRLIGNGP